MKVWPTTIKSKRNFQIGVGTLFIAPWYVLYFVIILPTAKLFEFVIDATLAAHDFWRSR